MTPDPYSHERLLALGYAERERRHLGRASLGIASLARPPIRLRVAATLRVFADRIEPSAQREVPPGSQPQATA